MKKLILLFAVLGLFLAACGPETYVEPPSGNTVNVQEMAPPEEGFLCVHPESDNGVSWDLEARVCYDTRAYTLHVKVLGDLSSNQTTSGTISGGSYGSYGSVSGRIWTEGKGILPVMILSMNPTASWLDTTLPYLLKTTDLKAMGIPTGAIVTVICQHDVETSSPSFSGQTLTTDRITDELDDCRLKTGNFTPVQ